MDPLPSAESESDANDQDQKRAARLRTTPPVSRLAALLVSLLASLRAQAARVDIRRMGASVSDAADIPIVVQLTAPADFIVPAGFRIADFRGLLHTQVLRAAAHDTLLLTYWRSAAAYHAQEPELRHRLGPVHVAWRRPLNASQSIRPSLWPSSVADALIKASALVGAAVALLGVWHTFFAAPTLKSLLPIQPVNATAGRLFTTSLTLVNLDTSQALRLDIGEATGTQGERVTPLRVRKPSALIDAGKGVDIEIEGQFDATGDGLIHLPVSVQAGKARHPDAPPQEIQVKVWPPWTASLLTAASAQVATTSQTFDGTLTPGDVGANGLECWAMTLGIDSGTRFATIIPARDDRPVVRKPEGTGATRVMRMTWNTGPVVPYRPIDVRIVLAADTPLAASTWAAMVSRLTWGCNEL
jgi:hypothetical protein